MCVCVCVCVAKPVPVELHYHATALILVIGKAQFRRAMLSCDSSCFNCFHLLFVFYDIGSDGKVILWERAARSGYNMFSVPCQVLTRATFIIVGCVLR